MVLIIFLFTRTLDGLIQIVLYGQMVFKLFLFSREQVIAELFYLNYLSEIFYHNKPVFFSLLWPILYLPVNSGSLVLLLIQTHCRVYGRPEAVSGLSVAAWCLCQNSSVKKGLFFQRALKGPAMKKNLWHYNISYSGFCINIFLGLDKHDTTAHVEQSSGLMLNTHGTH